MESEEHTVCDLVMKGGLTSGIIYPPAVLALKERYTFRSIGGTSAGAIAAAGTAAAEYNRAQGGFEALENVSSWLSEDRNLRNLFQANEATQPLLDILLAVLAPSTAMNTPTGAAMDRQDQQTQAGALLRLPLFLRLVKLLAPTLPEKVVSGAASLVHTWSSSYLAFRKGGKKGMQVGAFGGGVLGVVLALVVAGIVAFVAPGMGFFNLSLLIGIMLLFALVLAVVVGWLGWWIGRIVGAIEDIADLASNRLGNNFYGICTGHSTTTKQTPDVSASTTSTESTAAQPPVLTDWLCDTIDRLAGVEGADRPLTFGMLRGKQINLQMVTSNLSHSQPYILPQDLRNFIFCSDDMSQIFPDYIVEHLVAHAPKAGDARNETRGLVVPPEMLPPHYYFLPDAGDLPVVVAARLSLSFPVLLSAVPLYTVSTQAASNYWNGRSPSPLDEQRDLQKNWFSDGGICSNFPIQFFDDWLPTRPTFGINLTGVKSDANTSALEAPGKQPLSSAAQAREKNQEVYLPRAEEQQDVEWQNLDGIVSFLQSIYAISESYHDNKQAVLPSYRERIVQIRLNDDEGGLNLTMPRPVIQHIVQKGTEAAEQLLDPTKFDFDRHWWVRFLVLMSQLEENMLSLQEALCNPGAELTFSERLEREYLSGASEATKYPYYRDKAWCQNAMQRIEPLREVIANWQQANTREQVSRFFGQDAPQPDSVLRVTPRI